MNELPKYYTLLFAATADALDHLEHQNYGLAKEVLIQGQKLAEASYLSDVEDHPFVDGERLKFVIDQFHKTFSEPKEPETEAQV